VRAVLIVTNEQDVGADFLVQELGQRGVAVVRLNTERSAAWGLSLEPGASWRCHGSMRELRSADCSGVWWRRPEAPAPPAETGAAKQAVADQWYAFLAGLASVPGPTWVSDPADIRRAESKALQLQAAAQANLLVPETMWTNDILEASAFLEDGRLAVVKSVASAWWHVDGKGHFVFASPVESDTLPEAAKLAAAPVCLQRRIEPKHDIRVTIVEDVVLAAVRSAPDSSEPLDWRLGEPAGWVAHELPDQVAASCRDLVRCLNLRFAGIDLALDEAGHHWFLELNPNGEWGWLQHAGLPIAQALADTLTRE
jgi:glutathione synthase/RimK-type ligase-like ATP-grasp enzyme